MSVQGFATPAIEQISIKNHRLTFTVTVVGNTTEASVTASTNANNGITVWLSSASLTAPSNANFASLVSSATPTVIGIYLTDGRAVRLNRAAVETPSIQSASMTAGVVTFKGAAASLGTGRTGVTSDNNIAFQISCTTLLATAAALSHQFSVDLEYDVL